jgi:ankyrin repeat protein
MTPAMAVPRKPPNTSFVNGADANRAAGKHTPLFLASAAGEVKILEMLFDYGAKLDSDQSKQTSASPLSEAVRSRHIDCLEVLLKRGMKPTNAKNDPLSPLMYAITLGLVEGVEQLLERGADPNYVNQTKNCPMLLAARMNRPDIVQLLLDEGAKLDCTGPGGGIQRNSRRVSGGQFGTREVVEGTRRGPNGNR